MSSEAEEFIVAKQYWRLDASVNSSALHPASRNGEGADETMRSSKFLELPSELRVQIYCYHIESLPSGYNHPVLPPPITEVSRLVRIEALPLFYEIRPIEMIVKRRRPAMRTSKIAGNFFERAPVEQLAMIKKVRVLCIYPKFHTTYRELVELDLEQAQVRFLSGRGPFGAIVIQNAIRDSGRAKLWEKFGKFARVVSRRSEGSKLERGDCREIVAAVRHVIEESG